MKATKEKWISSVDIIAMTQGIKIPSVSEDFKGGVYKVSTKKDFTVSYDKPVFITLPKGDYAWYWEGQVEFFKKCLLDTE